MSESTASSEPQGPGSADAAADRESSIDASTVVPYTAPSWHTPRMLLAWAVAIVCSVLVVLWAPAETRFHWLALVIGFCTLVTFALQLGTAQREGFITRTSYSVAGCVLIVAIAYTVSVLVA